MTPSTLIEQEHNTFDSTLYLMFDFDFKNLIEPRFIESKATMDP